MFSHTQLNPHDRSTGGKDNHAHFIGDPERLNDLLQDSHLVNDKNRDRGKSRRARAEATLQRNPPGGWSRGAETALPPRASPAPLCLPHAQPASPLTETAFCPGAFSGRMSEQCCWTCSPISFHRLSCRQAKASSPSKREVQAQDMTSRPDPLPIWNFYVRTVSCG